MQNQEQKLWGQVAASKPDVVVFAGDSSFQGKSESRQAFLDYWKYISKLQPASAKGVEHSVILGTPGKRVQFIMLDTRFYATPWLEAELRKQAEYRVIVSPLQIAANLGGWERWGLFPLDRQKLFDTLRAAKAHKVMIVSGGRGFGSFAKVDLTEGYGPLYDMTVGPLNGTAENREQDFHYVGKAASSVNFGLIEWDWKKKAVSLKLMDENSQTVESLKLNL